MKFSIINYKPSISGVPPFMTIYGNSHMIFKTSTSGVPKELRNHENARSQAKSPIEAQKNIFARKCRTNNEQSGNANLSTVFGLLDDWVWFPGSNNHLYLRCRNVCYPASKTNCILGTQFWHQTWMGHPPFYGSICAKSCGSSSSACVFRLLLPGEWNSLKPQ